MTNKQRKFCDEYIIDCNASKAAERAGYSQKSSKTIGHQLTANPECMRLIRSRLDSLHNEKIADAKEIIEFLTSIMRGDSDAKAPEGIKDMSVSTKDRLRAAELLSKRYGILKETEDESADVPVIIDDLPKTGDLSDNGTV